MTADQFEQWLDDMRFAKLARSDAACARLLGVHANSIVLFKKQGADTRTALACRALLHRMKPYEGCE